MRLEVRIKGITFQFILQRHRVISMVETSDIIKYYNHRAAQYGSAPGATLCDNNARDLEIATAKKWIDKNDVVLDIFCGHGLTSVKLANHCKYLIGIDLSPKMMAIAEKRQYPGANFKFVFGDINNIDRLFKDGNITTVTSIRGLINLPSLDKQKQAIDKIYKLLPYGGKFICIEGWKDGIDQINKFRADYELNPIIIPWFDRYFNEEILNFILDKFTLSEDVDLSPYFLISRVLYPAACSPDEPDFNSICNIIARMSVSYLNSTSSCSLLKCLLFLKR